MRAITIQQPYAFAIAVGAKPVENRGRSIPWRAAVGERVAIHAGKTWYDGAEFDDRFDDLLVDGAMPDVPAAALGAVVAVATLAGVHWGGACRFTPVERQRTVDTESLLPVRPGLCSAWAEPDAWHLVWQDVRPLLEPVPTRGFQGLWTVPDGVLVDVVFQPGVSS